LNVPEAVGVPEIVMVFEAKLAVTPAGSPVAVPILVALVVEWVMEESRRVLIHKVGVAEATETVLFGLTKKAPEIELVAGGEHAPVTTT
jgi:hypothetical protein